MMFHVSVVIRAVHGNDHSEVILGKVEADSIGDLVKHASTLGDSFVEAVHGDHDTANESA